MSALNSTKKTTGGRGSAADYRYEMGCEDSDECRSWIQLFRQFDRDHDGFIPIRELKLAVRDSAGQFGLDPVEVGRLVTDVDANNDQLIDFPEFCQLMARAKRMRIQSMLFRAAKFVLPRSQRADKFSYLQQYTCCPPPIFMLLFSVLQLGLYFYYVGAMNDRVRTGGPVPVDSPLILSPEHHEQAWRFFTYSCIHIGIHHVVFNVLTQLLLGIPLELVHQWRIVFIYVFGIAIGGLLVAAVNPTIYLAGASGGCYALLAAHLADVFINFQEMEWAWLRTIVLVIMIGADAGVAVYESVRGTTNHVSYLAHLGGFVAGILLGIVVLRNLRKRSWERVVRFIAMALLVVFPLILIGIIVKNDVQSRR